MSCAAWAEPPVIRTRPPDIITTLSAPSTAAVLARHDRLCVATYLLFIEATPDIPSLPPSWSRCAPAATCGQDGRNGRADDAHGASPRSQVGPPAWPRKASAHEWPTLFSLTSERGRTTGPKRVIFTGNSDHSVPFPAGRPARTPRLRAGRGPAPLRLVPRPSPGRSPDRPSSVRDVRFGTKDRRGWFGPENGSPRLTERTMREVPGDGITAE